ncbi:MAG TPA: VPLPA-CTERM sorting domain-containing protein [Nitrospira sp.]|mgnify:CR=1 FL=1|nr:VPLPA-CTERM sorting domain-containing protein [Nitrospira sp.]
MIRNRLLVRWGACFYRADRLFIFATLAMVVGLSTVSAQAAIITTGDVTPSEPPWGGLTIGNTADGSVLINGGSAVTANGETKLAMTPGVTGTLTVDGAGSTLGFVGFGLIRVGTSSLPQNFAGGTGILNVTNGATVNTEVSIGFAFNTTGYLNITNGGRVTRGSSLGTNLLSTGIATVDGVGSEWNFSGTIGSRGTGLVKILNGATVLYTGSGGTTVGRYETGTGRVILDGVGSAWTMGGQFSVGPNMAAAGSVGAGGLVTVTNGATLSNQSQTWLGYTSRAVGTVMVNGAGSSWSSVAAPGSCTGLITGPVCGLNIGIEGTGHVSVSDSATLTTSALYLNNQSRLTVDLGTGSTVTSTGVLTNDGTIRMVAKATAANGTYAPISAGTWSGVGTVQAIGGIYDPATHSVTVSSAAIGQAGVATTIDRSVTQRILITDNATGQQVGASFQAAIAPANLSLTASLMNNSQLSLLQGLLDPGKAILSGWDFSATGYTTGDPVYLSLQIGGGQKFYDLDVWHFDGTSWAKYLNTDLAYDNQFASFVATGFSGYAVSGVAAVPVPAAVWLFGSGLAAMAGWARRQNGTGSRFECLSRS